MDSSPRGAKGLNVYQSTWIDTMLGPILAIADKKALVLLEFVDRIGLELEIKKLRKRQQCVILPGSNKILKHIEQELALYFAGKLQNFKTPINMIGSPFQQKVWEALQQIPYGNCLSYAQLAKKIDHSKAHRAVANVNGKNQIAIIIPCHRVINSNGQVGGYGGGIKRKQWLIELEKRSIEHEKTIRKNSDI